MDTTAVGTRPTESALTYSGRRKRPGQTEAEAAVRTLNTTWQELSLFRQHRNAPHEC